ncbi:MAG: ISL3 family transposase [Saprospiraceae bacterium]|nr:ISL3 family transposase [Saprospiraceae bacterium]
MEDYTVINGLLNLTGIEVTKIEIKGNLMEIECSSILEEQLCPCCLQKREKVKRRRERKIRDLSVFGKEVYLVLTTRQFYCELCDRYFEEKFDFVEGNRGMTKRLEAYLYQCVKRECLQVVGARENVQWEVLQRILEEYGKKALENLSTKKVTKLGIDEFAKRKGKGDYATVLVDLDSGTVIDVLSYRDKAGLIAYFKAKGKAYCENIKVFSCDMWEGFSNTAKAVFPNADVVIDRFHFFCHLNAVLDKQRKRLRKTHQEEEAFKRIKWLLFKAWEQLDQAQRKVLMKAFRLSPILRDLYFLKNELYNIFQTDLTKEQAEKLLDQWQEQAKALNNSYLNTFVNTLNNWKDKVLNFFKHRVSNGVVEGINNVIKMIKRQGFGYRNFEHFKLKIILFFD